MEYLAKQHGKLCRCVIKTLSDLPAEAWACVGVRYCSLHGSVLSSGWLQESVRIFLEFSTVDEAVKAQAALHGQDFGARRIKARYFNEPRLPGE